MTHARISVLALTLFLASPARADVLIQEAPELGVFRDPQVAVELAPEGATLLFGPEAHAGFTVAGKSLTLLGIGVGARVEGTVEIRDLAVGQSVEVVGLSLSGTWSYDYGDLDAVHVIDCEGAVRFSSCHLEGAEGQANDEHFFDPGGNGAVVEHSLDVAFLDCVVLGGNGAGANDSFCCTGGTGGVGVEATGSAIVLFDTRCVGGDGGRAGTLGGQGGNGFSRLGGRILASGSRFRGGAGGVADDFLFPSGGDGGHGLFLTGPIAPRLIDNVYLGGPGGMSYSGPNGQPGLPFVWSGGPLSELPGAHGGLTVDTPAVPADAAWNLSIAGEAGDIVYLGLVPVRPLATGAVLSASASSLTPVGVIPAGGVLGLALPVPNLLVGDRGATWLAHVFFRDVNGGGKRGGPILLSALDRSPVPDCDSNGTWDVVDVLLGALDCDANFELDSCQTTPDCNANGIPDGIEIDCQGGIDVNGNGVLDECEIGATVYVDPLAMAGGDGSLASPVRTLGEAFSLALDDWQIVLFDGLYTGPENRALQVAGRTLSISSLNGPNACVIDAEGADQIFDASVYAGPLLSLTGLTLQNGNGNEGGALVAFYQRVFIDNCVFRNCVAAVQGGAVYVADGSVIRNSSFYDNSSGTTGFSTTGGGAVRVRGRAEIHNCVFDFNVGQNGGAVSFEASNACSPPATVTNCVFRGNTATDRGGAIFVRGCTQPATLDLAIDNSFFANNTAANAGGALWAGDLFGSLPVASSITHSTFVGNDGGTGTAPEEGGGALFLGVNTTTAIFNSLLWGNTAARGSQIRPSGSAAQLAVLDADYSNSQGGASALDPLHASGTWGASMLDADPLFMNPTLGDYRLGAGSPCVDAGDVSAIDVDWGDVDGNGDTIEPVPLDLLGQPRRVDDPTAPDTGAGPAPVTDMGALERQP